MNTIHFEPGNPGKVAYQIQEDAHIEILTRRKTALVVRTPENATQTINVPNNANYAQHIIKVSTGKSRLYGLRSKDETICQKTQSGREKTRRFAESMNHVATYTALTKGAVSDQTLQERYCVAIQGNIFSFEQDEDSMLYTLDYTIIPQHLKPIEVRKQLRVF